MSWWMRRRRVGETAMLRGAIGLRFGLLAASAQGTVQTQERPPVVRGLAECRNISLPVIRAVPAPPKDSVGSQRSQPDVPRQDLPAPNLEEARRRIAVAQAQSSEELDLGGLSLREVPVE